MNILINKVQIPCFDMAFNRVVTMIPNRFGSARQEQLINSLYELTYKCDVICTIYKHYGFGGSESGYLCYIKGTNDNLLLFRLNWSLGFIDQNAIIGMSRIVTVYDYRMKR